MHLELIYYITLYKSFRNFKKVRNESSISAANTFQLVISISLTKHFNGIVLKMIPFFSVTDKERPYLIVKAVLRLSDPAAMDVVLRKRICFNVYKRHSITDKIRRRMGHTSSLTSLGVVYEIVSNIPKVRAQTADTTILT